MLRILRGERERGVGLTLFKEKITSLTFLGRKHVANCFIITSQQCTAIDFFFIIKNGREGLAPSAHSHQPSLTMTVLTTQLWERRWKNGVWTFLNIYLILEELQQLYHHCWLSKAKAQS